MGSIKGGMGARTDTPFRYGSAGMAKQLVGFAAGTPTARPTAQLSWNTAGDRLPPDCACAAQLHTRNGPQKPAALRLQELGRGRSGSPSRRWLDRSTP